MEIFNRKRESVGINGFLRKGDEKLKNRILIVEDEEKIARVLKLELEHEGYDVFVEHEGKSR